MLVFRENRGGIRMLYLDQPAYLYVERRRGQEHAGKAGGGWSQPKSLPCKIRVVWPRLDCLKSNLVGSSATPSKASWLISATPHTVVPACNRRKSVRRDAGRRVQTRDEWTAYPTLERTTSAKHTIAYGTRVLWRRSLHSSPRPGKPATWRREAGSSMFRLWRYARCETLKRY